VKAIDLLPSISKGTKRPSVHGRFVRVVIMNNGKEDLGLFKRENNNAQKQYVDENVKLIFPQRVSSKDEESDGTKFDLC
jgi:hypothetical protein